MVAQSHAWLETIKRVMACDASGRKPSPFWVWQIHRGARHEITFNHGKGLGQYSTIVRVKTAAESWDRE